MKKILIGLLLLSCFSCFAQECEMEELYEAIQAYENEKNPYSNGEFDYIIQDIKFSRMEDNYFIYEVIIHYEYSEGGYRLLDIKSKMEKSICETIFEVVDQS